MEAREQNLLAEDEYEDAEYSASSEAHEEADTAECESDGSASEADSDSNSATEDDAEERSEASAWISQQLENAADGPSIPRQEYVVPSEVKLIIRKELFATGAIPGETRLFNLVAKSDVLSAMASSQRAAAEYAEPLTAPQLCAGLNA